MVGINQRYMIFCNVCKIWYHCMSMYEKKGMENYFETKE